MLSFLFYNTFRKTVMDEFYNNMNDKTNKINQLKKAIAELRRCWPAHSVPPAMLQQLDDLEDELENAIAERKGDDEN